jgi:hypothetical protein
MRLNPWKDKSTMNVSQIHPGNLEVPKNIAPFVNKHPRMLPGESVMDYWAMFDLLMDDMVPATNTEWLVLADVAELFWDMQRYRAWKGAILASHRLSSLERALRDTHRSRAFVGELPALIGIARTEAEEWRTDPEKRKVLEARLLEHGYDEETINAGALIEALVPLATIDRFLSSARTQLNAMLKEVGVRREFADRARKALDERVRALVQAPKPAQIGPN